MSTYHLPVMLNGCMEGMAIKENGVYIDTTFGGGGHTQAILNLLGAKGRLYAFDQDEAARRNAQIISKTSFTFIQANFRHLKKYLRLHGIEQVDGILADLGVSSYQINTAARGFSTRLEGPLDMRMSASAKLTAAKVLNDYKEQTLHQIFGQYGEVRNAKTLARAVCEARSQAPLHTTKQLADVARKFAPKGRENKYLAQVFQSIRIEVNEELKALEELLVQSAEVLADKGRLVMLAYHSLEDRWVKNFINKGKCYGEPEKDLFGHVHKPFQVLTKKPLTPSEEEINQNPRARSAKLRIAEKI